MIEHLKAAYPLEGCGIMAGKESLVCRIYPITNRLASPIAYEMDPKEQLVAMLDIEDRGCELLAIYHSHPNGPEAPSASDVLQAYYPEAYYVIVSWRQYQNPVIRAYRIVDGMVKEVPYRVL
jgi:proteasome lid subunit RPN8/RPN11